MAKGLKVRTGVQDLYFDTLATDTGTSGPTYSATPTAVPGLISISINPNTNSATLYADNKAAVTYSTVGTIEVELELDHLSDDVIGVLTGRTEDTNDGHNFVTNINNAPYVGIMFKQTYDNGSHSIVRLLKGKFKEPEQNSETQNDSVNFQTGTISAEFIATSSTISEAGAQSVLMITQDSESTNYAAPTGDWFAGIYPLPATA